MILNPSKRDPAARHPVVKRIANDDKGRRNFFMVNPPTIARSRSESLRIVLCCGKNTRDPAIKRNINNGSIATEVMSTIILINISDNNRNETTQSLFSSLGGIS